MTTDTPETTTCHLLNLPAELRLRIFEEALSPGVLCLNRTATKRFAVTPTISPLILATCRQVYIEASKLLYFDNEVTLTIDVHDTFAPVINESRLPQRALEKLQHVCLVCDGTANLWGTYDEYIDFTPLAALVSLKSLRLCVLYSAAPDESIEAFTSMLSELVKQILAHVPATVQVYCELDLGSYQAELVEYVRAKGAERYRGNSGRSFTAITGSTGGSFTRNIHVVPSEMIREAVSSVDLDPGVRGSKSGAELDVFAEHRAMIKGFTQRS